MVLRNPHLIMGFKDHFSGHADDYTSYRPSYPAELFTSLAQRAPAHALAWDCATGSGQAALGLAAQFEVVIATHASLHKSPPPMPIRACVMRWLWPRTPASPQARLIRLRWGRHCIGSISPPSMPKLPACSDREVCLRPGGTD
jgi:hypothetical protein